MRIAAIQMVSDTQVSTNLQVAGELVTQAAAQGAELVVLPEYFCLLAARDTDKLAAQEEATALPIAQGKPTGPIQAFLADTARRHQVWLVGGTLALSTAQRQRVRNSCLVFDPQGQQVARYDKIHLFSFDNGCESYDESRVIEPGTTPVCFSLPSRDGHTWRVGLSVCYDLRFAALYRALQADLLLVPSAFTHTTGQAHWETLLRARAIENLAYVAAPAQGGQHANGRSTWGHTMVVSSWGEVLAQRAEGAGVVLADISMAQLLQRRAQLPALAHYKALPPVTHSA
jgi:deaminated glutathione amidase